MLVYSGSPQMAGFDRQKYQLLSSLTCTQSTSWLKATGKLGVVDSLVILQT